MPTFATKNISTSVNGQKEDAASGVPFCPLSFDRAVMVAQWYYDHHDHLRLETPETRIDSC